MIARNIGAELVQARADGWQWKALVVRFGLSRARLAQLLEAEIEARGKMSIDNASPSLARAAAGRAEEPGGPRCAGCAAFWRGSRPHPAGGAPIETAQCRLMPVPVEKDPEGWCLQWRGREERHGVDDPPGDPEILRDPA
jgi:hypothetical protein